MRALLEVLAGLDAVDRRRCGGGLGGAGEHAGLAELPTLALLPACTPHLPTPPARLVPRRLISTLTPPTLLPNPPPHPCPRFLRFVTGSPRLPPGGLAALQPRLTVVRKHTHAPGGGGLSGVEGTSAPLGLSLQSSAPSLGGSVPPGVRHPADSDLPSGGCCRSKCFFFCTHLPQPPFCPLVP